MLFCKCSREGYYLFIGFVFKYEKDKRQACLNVIGKDSLRIEGEVYWDEKEESVA